MTHLEGETVYVATDGNSSQTAEVSSGAVVLTDFYNAVSIGLYTTKEIYLMPYEQPRTLGRSKHVVGLLIAAFRVLGGRYGPMGVDGTIDSSRIRDFDWSSTSDAWDWEVSGFTGVKTITDLWGIADRHTLVIQQPEPLPMTIMLVQPDIQEVS